MSGKTELHLSSCRDRTWLQGHLRNQTGPPAQAVTHSRVSQPGEFSKRPHLGPAGKRAAPPPGALTSGTCVHRSPPQLWARLSGTRDSHTAVQPPPPSSPGRSIFPQGRSVPVKPPLPPLPQPQPRRGLPVSAGLPPAGPACEWGLTGPSPCVWFTSLSTSSSLTHAAAGARASFPRLNDTP